ncbi:UbiH/UbiF/VisC/COQ6 family ubiquinone biosynthesis hydroxylase [Parvularcula sp. ZS-1/3]|uniref:UbiH/UbiF/VisC/COQ6 family ubiquinone biosynthesis hydroxylase n=1 Tax=Parvularcula mediterranea TaxID=2732508 RepID=A0A7Y3RKT0_9PROT|nr:UbiH/UbiF/VisC/COQ6 family ubiquinone biosynthesis hydroxylase [Parvularcula mediterranea]NNU15889.1 UbiH/UbiF/VisC/COQ6 family ubiquinone biosynthesis hydroxylase [Parvularcula mediterranea]
MTQTFDTAVVGAGMTGRLLALALDHLGFKVALIDRGLPSTPIRDGRTVALAYASVRLFKRLGLWEDLAPKAEPITDIMVSNGEPRGRFSKGGLFGGQLHFPVTLLGTDETEGEEALGYIVENADLLAVCAEALEGSAVEGFYGASVVDYDAGPGMGHGKVSLSDGTTIETKLLAACDGKFSPLRARMKLETVKWGYDQTAIIFNVKHEEPHGGVAHEVFYPDGPFAILPMRNNHSSIVWTERNASVKSFLAMDDTAFLEAARERIGDHLGALELAGERQSFPLSFLYAPKLTADRFVLAGDAAHGIHPIAGQGFNLGVKDIAALCETVDEARQAGLDIGHGTVLAGYDSWRRFDSASLAFGTDTLNRLFSNNFGPLKHLRGVGLGIVQRIDPARRFFMRASGADLGKLPALMQPL